MNVHLFALLFSLSFALAYENENRETPNIRHGRSRARLLRASHHNADEEYKFSINNAEVNVSSPNSFGIGAAEPNKLRTPAPHVKETTTAESKPGRKITVDANFSLHKELLHRVMNQLSQHAEGGNHEAKSAPHQANDFDQNPAHVEPPYDGNDDEDDLVIELTTEIAKSGHVDIVTRFLRIVESQHLLGENCTAGTHLNLGEGVVDRYAQERFRVEADVAVNRANMLTRLWKYADPNVVLSEYLLHASVFSMVEFDNDIFAAGNCYDQYQYKDYWLFCPYAYRLPEGEILVKDLAVEYKYLSNTSEWFYIARKNAENVIKNYNQFSRGTFITFYPDHFTPNSLSS